MKDTGKGAVVWEARAVRFHPHEGDGAGDEQWLLVARNCLTGEIKYFFSNAPESTPREAMLRVAFSRSEVEHLFHEAKGEVGRRSGTAAARPVLTDRGSGTSRSDNTVLS